MQRRGKRQSIRDKTRNKLQKGANYEQLNIRDDFCHFILVYIKNRVVAWAGQNTAYGVLTIKKTKRFYPVVGLPVSSALFYGERGEAKPYL